MMQHLLVRTGVLTREILDRATIGLTWREAYPLLTRMGWAREVDQALFISGLSGPQFAFRDAAESLGHSSQDDEMALLNVSDPANVFGDLFPILRPDGVRHIIRHHPGNYLVLENGHPLLAVENRGERLIPLSDLTPPQRAACFQTLAQLVEGRHRNSSIRAMTWDGSPIVNSLIEEELAAVGFIRENPGMILYRTYS